MQDKSPNNHECEDSVEGKGNRIVWAAKIEYRGIADFVVQKRGLVIDDRDPHCWHQEHWLNVSPPTYGEL